MDRSDLENHLSCAAFAFFLPRQNRMVDETDQETSTGSFGSVSAASVAILAGRIGGRTLGCRHP
jgi:hypothetical protein